MPGSPERFAARILIVDDQESNVRLLAHTLRRGGYVAVSETTCPLEVSALARESSFQLIILDLQMPRMNGYEVMKALKLAGNGPPPSILVMSADPAQMVPALEAGATSFLSKPFVLSDVLLRVDLILTKSVDGAQPTAAGGMETRDSAGSG
jgi:CheY-like chemotaxis protein